MSHANAPCFGGVADDLRRVTVQVLSGEDRSIGSGVITGPSAVVTNAHVVSTRNLEVRLSDGTSIRATLGRRDRSRDLAILHLGHPLPGLAPPTLRETTSLRSGEIVIAVGHPLGFIGAVSTGVIRTVWLVPGLGDRSWIQAAVRLAPGNSGGPLADVHGRVVGINAMVMNGLGLAIPSEAVQRFLSAAPSFHLGVTVRPARLRDGTRGLLILQIEAGSPAGSASLLPGDLITGLGTAPVGRIEALDNALSAAGLQRAESVFVRFRRGGSDRERCVTAARQTYAASEQAVP